MENKNEIHPVHGGGKSKIIETYAEDMAKVIEDSKEGLIKKIIHGEEEHEKEKRNLSPESTQNKLFMLTSALFVSISLAVLFFSFFNKDGETVEPEKQFIPLIFNDKNAFLEVKGFSKEEIAQTVLNEIKGAKIKNGGVEGIYLTLNKKIIGLREFIKIIKGNFQPEADRPLADGLIELVSDNFLMGMMNNEVSQSTLLAARNFFIIIKMRSLLDVFDSLRAWENKMFFDLHGFFGISLSGETEYLLTKDFEDGIVENKNARILYDKENKIVMMYIFADDTSVIIANTESAVREIMLRLSASQVKK